MSLTKQASNTSGADQGACLFLQLPSEIRDIIYDYHLTSEKILPRFTIMAKRWTPIDLLYVSRTIYNEAFFHLYTKGEFVLDVGPDLIFGLSTCCWRKEIDASAGLERFVRNKMILPLLRHIALNIHWPSDEYTMHVDRNLPAADTRLQQTMVTVGTMLSTLPALRTVDVSWSHATDLSCKLPLQYGQSEWLPDSPVLQLFFYLSNVHFASEETKDAPPKYMIPGWLRGLKHVRRKNEKVRIRMPLTGPVSTEQLSEDQKVVDKALDTLREVKEDIEKLNGQMQKFFP